MNVPFFLASRLSLGGSGRKSAPAIKIAATAVALSIAVMIATIAIVVGFKREIRSKVLGFNPHVSIYSAAEAPEDSPLITLTPSLNKLLKDIPFIESFSLEASIPAILKTTKEFKGVYLKSSTDRQLLSFLEENLENGKIPIYSQDSTRLDILISRKTANELSLSVGDKIDTYFLTGDIRVRRLNVIGVFNSHFDSYDNIYIFGSLPLIQELGETGPSKGTVINVHTDNFDLLAQRADSLRLILNAAYNNELIYHPLSVETALSQGAGYFHWLNLLDTNVIVILTLMIIVATVTLISGMLIIILDKKKFIGILRSMGATIAETRRVFIYLAIRVALVGMVLGNLLMLGLLMLQNEYHFLKLDPEAYYIDFVPVELDWKAFGLLNLGVLFVIYLSLILPSRFVARISPSETIRFE